MEELLIRSYLILLQSFNSSKLIYLAYFMVKFDKEVRF